LTAAEKTGKASKRYCACLNCTAVRVYNLAELSISPYQLLLEISCHQKLLLLRLVSCCAMRMLLGRCLQRLHS
jgi:hypothetical protein